MQKYNYTGTEKLRNGIKGFIYPVLQAVGMLLVQTSFKNKDYLIACAFESAFNIKKAWFCLILAVGRITPPCLGGGLQNLELAERCY